MPAGSIAKGAAKTNTFTGGKGNTLGGVYIKYGGHEQHYGPA